MREEMREGKRRRGQGETAAKAAPSGRGADVGGRREAGLHVEQPRTWAQGSDTARARVRRPGPAGLRAMSDK